MVKIKKSINNAVEELNSGGTLAAELRLGAVALSLSKLEESVALEVLANLAEAAEEVQDPIAWVKETARHLLEEPEPVEEEAPSIAQELHMRPGDWKCIECGDLVFARNAACRTCGTPRPATSAISKSQKGTSKGGKPGDWICPQCSDLQFARNSICRSCQTPKPEDDESAATLKVRKVASQIGKPGDWTCPNCGDLQYARNSICRMCQTPKPTSNKGAVGKRTATHGKSDEQPARAGDWYCPECDDLQFARNSFCRNCETPRPPAKGGDWYCPECGDLQFARNSSCRKCQTPRPEEDWEDEQGEWEQPVKKKKKLRNAT